ncbi:DUF6252 family protein [Gilvibacter sediminis]|uniref:DUF6252 family protein n=1 Tax=Gilvibacter sediminis TaxID=379071 RepID=UPI002350A251|nr:DUF6252 family protein [Gilvibacter sediminis]MDC7997236.1 DUF6252 family protein [Gilvibacter sediminis]
MQRIALFALLVFALFSCEDVRDNNAIIQGNANDVFLKGGAVATRFDDGTVVINGSADGEELTITLTSAAVGTYAFGPGSANGAVFMDASGESYSTATALGNGEANISESSSTDNTITGTFNFNAHTFALQDTLNFSRGVFFKVPVIGGTGTADDPGFSQGMSATVDGASFEAVTLEGINLTGNIVVTGVDGTRTINMRFPNTVTPGDYDLALGEFEATYGIDGVATAGTSGTLTIISNNVGTGEIQGTFSYSGDAFEITDGAFAVIY